jgi:hypothetical protein
MADDAIPPAAAPISAKPEVPTPIPQKRKDSKQATHKDYLITAVLLAVLVWEVGLYDATANYITDYIDSQKPKTMTQDFNIITPYGDAYMSAENGDFQMTFLNSGTDEAVVQQAALLNLDGGKCQVTSQLPVKLAVGDRLNLTGTGCSKGGASYGKTFRIGAIINGTTSLRSKLLSDTRMMFPFPTENIPDDQMKQMKEQRTEQLNRMEGLDNPSPFTSSGPIYGIYS